MSVAHQADFWAPWSLALAASQVEPSRIATPIILHVQGYDLSLIHTVLAVAGVLMARPLARKRESALPLSQFLVVTAIMMIVAVAFVAESHHGILFTFVVSIGLGFSGYSLIETAGDQIADFIKGIIAKVTDSLGSGGSGK